MYFVSFKEIGFAFFDNKTCISNTEKQAVTNAQVRHSIANIPVRAFREERKFLLLPFLGNNLKEIDGRAETD